jgi:hypothetical protein
MKVKTAVPFFISLYHLAAVRGHGHGEPKDGESMEDYAKRHVKSNLCRLLDLLRDDTQC